MSSSIIRNLSFAALAASVSTAFGAAKLASPFADGMVLQRDRPVPVWGTALPGEKVTVTFAGQEKSAVANAAGEWRLNLDAMPASKESRTLTVSSSAAGRYATEDGAVADVLVGEVWFASGQSNMELPLTGGAPNFRDRQGNFIAQWTHRRYVRLCRASDYRWSRDELKTAPYKVTWNALSPATLQRSKTCSSYSAVAVYFAIELYDALEVPIGIVGSWWGGTNIDAWTPRCGTASRPDLKDVLNRPRFATTNEWYAAKVQGGPFSRPQQEPAVLFNEMVNPWCPFAMRGFIWYQGCHNGREPERYCSKMHALYNGWAEKFENPNLKLYFVALAPWRKCDGFTKMQLAQAQFVREQPNSAIAFIGDLGNLADIHPNEKELVGKRLAAHALRRDYGFDIQDNSPTLKSAKVEKGKFVLEFNDAKGMYLYNLDRDLKRTGFEIAGSDGVFKPAIIENMKKNGVIEKLPLVVSSPEVKEPKRIRFLFSDPWYAALYSEVSLPVGPFIWPNGN